MPHLEILGADRGRFLLSALLPGFLGISAALLTRLTFPAYHDEKYYFPLAAAFSRGPTTTELVRTYHGIPSAVGPVVFGVYGLWMRLAGTDPATVRWLSVLLGVAAGIVFALAGRHCAPSELVRLGLALGALLHFLTSTITFLSEPLTLVSALAGVVFWLRGIEGGRTRDFGLSALCLAAAANARAPVLALPISLALAGALWIRRSEATAAPLLAIAAQIPCWLLWGGPLPPTQSLGMINGVSCRPGVHPESTLHLLTVAGFCCWPALRSPRAWSAKGVAWSVLGLGLYLAFGPDLSRRFAGPLTRMASLCSGAFRPFLILPFLAGWQLLGQLAVDALDRSHTGALRALALAGIAGAGIYTASPLASERYALMFTPFWLLALAPRLGMRPRLWSAWIVIQLVIAAVAVAGVAGVID